MEEYILRTKNKSRAPINAAILLNQTLEVGQRRTSQELATEFDVPISAIYTQIKKLRDKGLLPHEVVPGVATPPPPALNQEIDIETVFKRILAGEVISRPDRRRVLSIMSVSGGEHQRTQAIKLLNEMDSSETRGVGPPPPTDEVEQIERVSRILQASGEPLSLIALQHAFGASYGKV